MAVALSDAQEPVNSAKVKRKRWWVGIRTRAIQALGGRCAHCGYDTVLAILQLDHIEPRRGRRTGSDGYRQKREWIRASRGDTQGLQLLCPNCHAIKTIAELEAISWPNR